MRTFENKLKEKRNLLLRSSETEEKKGKEGREEKGRERTNGKQQNPRRKQARDQESKRESKLINLATQKTQPTKIRSNQTAITYSLLGDWSGGMRGAVE